uniref:GDT1 family protein n=1 Tax=Alexandrium monilatum TaxID=311494 RepID=A0A7S4QGX9_9DINO
MAFQIGTLFHYWLLAMLADLGDKTWMMTTVCSAWCPICGIRDNSPGVSVLEYLLLFVGASFALVLRSILLAFGINPFAWDGFCEVSATVILLLAGLKATYEWRCSLYEGGDELAVRPPSTAEERLAIKDLENTGKDAGELDRWDWLKVLSTAMLLPGFIVLFTEAGDRSQGVLTTASNTRADFAIGASLGFVSSSLLAVVAGFVIKKRVTVKWLLFWVFALTWLVDISCLRDALLRLLLGSVPLSSRGTR